LWNSVFNTLVCSRLIDNFRPVFQLFNFRLKKYCIILLRGQDPFCIFVKTNGVF
jgi:hypothetical protein